MSLSTAVAPHKDDDLPSWVTLFPRAPLRRSVEAHPSGLGGVVNISTIEHTYVPAVPARELPATYL
jgi:hypothetical protein